MEKSERRIYFIAIVVLYLMYAINGFFSNQKLVGVTNSAFPFWLALSSAILNPLILVAGFFLVPGALRKAKTSRVIVGLLLLPAFGLFVLGAFRILKNAIRYWGSIEWHWWDVSQIVIDLSGSILVVIAYFLLIRGKSRGGQAEHA